MEGGLDADASGRSLRGVLGCLSGALGGSWRSLGEAPRGPREALEASWRPLGGVLELLKRLGRLRGGFQGPMGRSWKRPGALLGAFWSALGPSWRPPGRPKVAQRRPKRLPNGATEAS